MSGLFAAVRSLRQRKFFVPEVLQTSMMDCGPATLKSVFDGHRRPINLERLRERCQTEVDGTSLSAMREAAERLGLDVQEVMVPRDNLLLEEAQCLPAIVFVANPDGLLHFVTVWNVVGDWVQIMDPARGRTWARKARILQDVATITLKLSAHRWREWASGEDFTTPLIAKLRAVGFGKTAGDELVARAAGDPSPRSFAALDAATRMVRSLVDANALRPGAAARALLTRAFEADRAAPEPSIPEAYWTCRPTATPDTVSVRGAVLLCVAGVAEEKDDQTAEEEGGDDSNANARAIADPADSAPATAAIRGTMAMPDAPGRAPAGRSPLEVRSTVAHDRRATRLSMIGEMPALGSSLAARATRVDAENVVRQSIWAGPVVPAAVMNELRAETVSPVRIFARILWDDSKGAVILLAVMMLVGMATAVLDAMLMRGLSDLVGQMNLVAHRLVAIAAVAVFLVVALVFEISQALIIERLARGLETRLRVSFLEKLPRLEDRYFRSRPVSDMASRAHLLQTLRGVPRFVVDAVSGVLRLVATAGVLIWLDRSLWKLCLTLLFVCLTMPVVSYRLVEEGMARMRIQGAALFRFYLDALLGVIPIRVHGGERVIRREHEGILAEWVRSGRSVETRTAAIKAFDRILGTVASVAIVVVFVKGGGDLRSLLLVAFFALRLPSEAEALVSTMRRYPLLKHDALRIFEPLAATEVEQTAAAVRPRSAAAPTGVDIVFRAVTAVAGGRPVVSDVNLAIRRGTDVAIVGPSGAGKSSLVSVLLGWLFVSEGRVLIDGRPLDAPRLALLREETAWVDPAVQLWNTTLLENLLYGHGDDGLPGLERALADADLLDVVERMPDGLQNALGEGGGRVSGGQGQRVRLGRALLKRDARLVILDEPFRGLERAKRRALLRSARALWKHATILFVSHDVGDTLEMDRVVVVEEGHVVEEGTPAELLARDGTYASLVQGDRDALDDIWGRPEWKRLVLDDGRLRSRSDDGAIPVDEEVEA